MAQISYARIGQFMKAVLAEIDRQGGEARPRDILPAIEPSLNLTDYEKARLDKSGYVRWVSIIRYYSIDCVKAGYLLKAGGKWSITDAGRKALKKSDEEFMLSAARKYRDWKKNKCSTVELAETSEDESGQIVRQAAYDQAVEQAQSEIEEHIFSLGPYEFQQLVSELLTAMGYHVTYIAPPGPDGGIDIIAYSDPLGTTKPRLKIQVKHRRTNKVTVQEVRQLQGILGMDGDMGYFVSSGGYTPDAAREMRAGIKHIEFIDLDKLIQLWCKYYDKVSEPGKALLPLVKLYFLAPTQE
ncbi:restriction endonuclease [Desulfocurvibacter africanus]|uniref:Restriction endonuclease n=1 Tax=Desulfocurvibacter africanus subsp. africanus str. Walvis Bay TaxID=690850 RepID=F3YXG5_DESAF|nr:restriction endonuclease [Desulfocurvibacter africanus]EGJ51742.1 restriction endonuclease [Desulfocurvibacter africanus subsp. africanus str. Walvis Bay]